MNKALEYKINKAKPTTWLTDGIPQWQVWLIVLWAKFKCRLRHLL